MVGFDIKKIRNIEYISYIYYKVIWMIRGIFMFGSYYIKFKMIFVYFKGDLCFFFKKKRGDLCLIIIIFFF